VKQKYGTKKRGLQFSLKRLKEAEPNPNNRFEISIPGGGTIEVQGTGEFVSTILRQLLDHPESLVAAELCAGYQEMPPDEQKRFRQDFKIGEFGDPGDVAWPSWL
jgi:hypothetical protein